MRSTTAIRHLALFLISVTALSLIVQADEGLPTPIKALHPGQALSADELAHLLDAHVWKFRVEPPPGARRFQMSLEIREREKNRRAWGCGLSGFIGPRSDGQVLVAILPVGGQPLNDADKVRIVLSGFNGSVASCSEDNPFKKLGIGRPGTPEQTKDGSFDLIGAYSGRVIGSPVSSADKAISLRITTSENRQVP
jgi:hypothetical protein